MLKKSCIIMLILFSLHGCESISSDGNLSIEIESTPLSEVYASTKFICSDITDNSFFFVRSTQMYNNGKIYNIDFEKNKYNNENCLLTDNVNFSSFFNVYDDIYGSIFQEEDAPYYFMNGSYKNGVWDLNHRIQRDWTLASLKNIISGSRVSFQTDPIDEHISIYRMLLLKTDGNLYNQEVRVEVNNDAKKYSTSIYDSFDDIAYSKEKYGFIKYFYSYPSNDNKTYDLILFTENGIYTLPSSQINGCDNDEKGICKVDLVKNEELDPFIDQIIYFDIYRFIDSNFNVYSSKEFINLKYIPWY